MEKAIMMRDLEEIIASHANGIAVGALTAVNDLDKPFLEEIAKLAIANGTELVFHMAFDQIPEDKQRDALLWLREIGFTRILTHGGPTENTIFDNAAHIADLAKISPDMTIMPGGGITKDNLADLEKVLEFNEVHGTRIV
jgi:copper homeostasis protein